MFSENGQQQPPVPSLVVSMGVQTGITSQTEWPTAKQQPCCLAVGNILSSKSLKNMSAMRERGEKRSERREDKQEGGEKSATQARARTRQIEGERVGERAREGGDAPLASSLLSTLSALPLHCLTPLSHHTIFPISVPIVLRFNCFPVLCH